MEEEMFNELVRFFNNTRKAKSVGFELLPKTHINYGTFHFDNYIKCYVGDFTFNVSSEFYGLFYSYRCQVYVDNILVYESGWIHSVPKEMKRKIKESLQVIKDYNKKCKSHKLNSSYKQRLKEEEFIEKQKKIAKFESDKKKLIDKFTTNKY
jgi:hypothetical protein